MHVTVPVMCFSPAEVAHAGSHLHLLAVDVHAPADAVYALHRHGAGQGALTHHQAPLGSRGQSGSDESSIHGIHPGAVGAPGRGHLPLHGPAHGAHAHLVSVSHPADGALRRAFEGLLVDNLHITRGHPSHTGEGATERTTHG